MATPRVKRPFAGSASDPAQRHITSFFARDESPPPPADHSRSRHNEPSTPMLPPSVQANLLAVGMRVRKSVPEGYKTGKDLDGDEAVFVGRRAAPAHKPYSPFVNSSNDNSATPPPPPPTQRELLPFCGLHKIGGLGVQSFGGEDGRPMFASSLFRGMEDEGGEADEAPPSLTSSQETVSSTASDATAYAAPALPSRQSRLPSRLSTTSSATRKRVYGAHEETEGGGRFEVHEDGGALPRPSYSSSVNRWLVDDGEISPRTIVAPHNTPFFQLGRRVLAVPRRRQQRSHSQSHSFQQGLSEPLPHEQPRYAKPDGLQGGVRVLDQENADVMGDFDEADFLDASMLADGGGHDMEMGGM